MHTENDYYYEPATGHGLAHDPLKSIISPRPIGWISSVSSSGQRNLAPYSFFNCFSDRPPIIGFSSSGWKDSVANIAETGEFAWNLATRELAAAMNNSSASLPADQDEFQFAGLTPKRGRRVNVDYVAESPVNFECKLTQCIQLKNADGALIDNWLVLGEVIAVHIHRDLINAEGIYQTTVAQPILRGGGPSTYYQISDDLSFDLFRPTHVNPRQD
ncbi:MULTISPECIES: flavin reductase family protein [Yersinia]|jgi:flavin reductase (DIM6/NTAB) family NADH-FMN oxidoreductase RutF|uniref:Flavin reductase-like, FMN-binding domain protein n=1 Tax=Yersinia frederiksenii TaxID=29484 RepID=A0AAI8ZSZ9_YERFR|nr:MULTISPECIES: flavin reductase family protein [Yersinia]HEC1651276.1 flavin reductase family protein [Yersinia enterocolitica]MDN0128236.1 flavin reductase family protein [Yersinia massiliensis]CFR07443.1 flavin reductase-like%2C FMN-binding domain protein [Yersinia frederiksenii]CNK61070.1 flavin reductase-like%2C FMN-binding domain protein [Yersinia frederiksenii]CQH22827.1 flavin reductase-like%2C FMN-binding domain protein [Yersinia frederiksenii]